MVISGSTLRQAVVANNNRMKAATYFVFCAAPRLTLDSDGPLGVRLSGRPDVQRPNSEL